MASGANDFFGFEILEKLVEKQVHKKEDVIILFAHWFFVKNGFRCIGLGDSKTFDPNEEGSELLPEGWSENDHYALRYLKEGKLYILLGRKSDADLLLNFLRIADNCLSTIKFSINTTVASIHGPLQTLIENHHEALKKIQKELVEPVYTGTAREMSTQTATELFEFGAAQQERRRVSPVPYDNPLRLPAPEPIGRQPWNPEADPRGIGRHDVDPFAGVGPRGGGMIFDPFGPANRGVHDPLRPRPGGIGGPPHLPAGAIPPGARFDPFGPPDLVQPRPRPRNPDHDHLPPPGYDDMFM